MTLPGRAVVHKQKIPYHLKKAKRLRIKLKERELGNEQSINERLYQLQEMAEGGKTEMDEKSAAPEPAGSKEKKAPKPHSHGPGTKPHVH